MKRFIFQPPHILARLIKNGETTATAVLPERLNYTSKIYELTPMENTFENLKLAWPLLKKEDENERDRPSITGQEESTRKLTELRIAWVGGWPEYLVDPSIQKFMAAVIYPTLRWKFPRWNY